MISISVIIPMYNAGKRIIRCLKSILKQTYQDYELILIDDGSTDATIGEVERFLSINRSLKEKTRLVKKSNSGVADTRNLGIELSEGVYISFVDQDDYIAEDYLEKFIDEALNTDSDIVVGGYIRFDDEGKVLHRERLKNTKWAKYIITAPWAHIYKRSFIKEHELHFLNNGLGEDIFLNVLAYQNTNRISIISYEGYRWYYNTASVSNSLQNTIRKEIDPIYLLDSIYYSAEKTRYREDDFLEYFFTRFICWYFLYSSKGSKKEDVLGSYDSLMGWLKDKYPDYRKQKYLLFKMPKGENPKYSAYVTAFYSMERMGILRTLLVLLGK